MQKFAAAHPNQENVGEYYDNIDGSTYDAFIKKINFTDPYNVAKAIYNPVPEVEVDPETGAVNYGYLGASRDAAIVDIGCGTGISGQLLHEQGFTNLQAADVSQTYVDAVNATGWYTSCGIVWFGKGVEALPANLVGKYDVVMATGVFMDGHIPPCGFEDAHAMCKPGGHFITSMRRCYYEIGEGHGYKEKLDEMVAAGKIEIVKTWEFMRGIKDAQDPIFTEMPSFMFVAKRIN